MTLLVTDFARATIPVIAREFGGKIPLHKQASGRFPPTWIVPRALEMSRPSRGTGESKPARSAESSRVFAHPLVQRDRFPAENPFNVVGDGF